MLYEPFTPRMLSHTDLIAAVSAERRTDARLTAVEAEVAKSSSVEATVTALLDDQTEERLKLVLAEAYQQRRIDSLEAELKLVRADNSEAQELGARANSQVGVVSARQDRMKTFKRNPRTTLQTFVGQ